jgi:hypothetical protein
MEHMGMGKGKVAVDKNGTVNVQNLKEFILSVNAGSLTDVEKEDLMYMVEEEKLARDVYLTLYDSDFR